MVELRTAGRVVEHTALVELERALVRLDGDRDGALGGRRHGGLLFCGTSVYPVSVALGVQVFLPVPVVPVPEVYG